MENNNAPILITLTPDKLEELMKVAGEAGAKAAMQRASEEKDIYHKKIVDKRLYNTKLLLKNYHMLKLNMDCSIYSKSQLKESVADILNDMMNLYDDEVIIDSIKRSAARTAIIINHIDIMIGLYQAYCSKSKRAVDARRFQVLFDFYISDKLKPVRVIAKELNQSQQTIYDDLKVAEERLTALFFGINGLKMK